MQSGYDLSSNTVRMERKYTARNKRRNPVERPDCWTRFIQENGLQLKDVDRRVLNQRDVKSGYTSVHALASSKVPVENLREPFNQLRLRGLMGKIVAKDRDGDVPLQSAVYSGVDHQAVDFILNYETQMKVAMLKNKNKSEETALESSLRLDTPDVFELLLKQCIQCGILRELTCIEAGQCTTTLLHLCIQGKHIAHLRAYFQVCLQQLQAKPYLCATDGKGRTPWYYLLHYSNDAIPLVKEVLAILEDHEIDVGTLVVDRKTKETMLHRAYRHNKTEFIALLEGVCGRGVTDRFKRTPQERNRTVFCQPLPTRPDQNNRTGLPQPNRRAPVQPPQPNRRAPVQPNQPNRPAPVQLPQTNRPTLVQPAQVQPSQPNRRAPVQPPQPNRPAPVQPPQPNRPAPVQPPQPNRPAPVQPPQPTPVQLPQPNRPAPVQLPQPTPVQPPQPTLVQPSQPNRPTSVQPPQPNRPAPVQPNRPTSVQPPQPNRPTSVQPPQPNRPTSVQPPQPNRPAPVQLPQPTPVQPPQPTLVQPFQPNRPTLVQSPQPAPVQPSQPNRSTPVELYQPKGPVPALAQSPHPNVAAPGQSSQPAISAQHQTSTNTPTTPQSREPVRLGDRPTFPDPLPTHTQHCEPYCYVPGTVLAPRPDIPPTYTPQTGTDHHHQPSKHSKTHDTIIPFYSPHP